MNFQVWFQKVNVSIFFNSAVQHSLKQQLAHQFKTKYKTFSLLVSASRSESKLPYILAFTDDFVFII